MDTRDDEVNNQANEWEIVTMIGEGFTGKVFKVRSHFTSETVAVKVINFDRLFSRYKGRLTERDLLNQAVREANALSLVQGHPNIVELYECHDFRNEVHMWMEYINGIDLLQLIFNSGSTGGGMSEKMARPIFRQICEALKFCHEKNLVHGDLKMENVIVTSNMKVKLIDFGFADTVEKDVVKKSHGGTKYYSPPEKYLTKGWDVWSMGVVLYAMLTRKFPFKSRYESDKKLVLKIPKSMSQEASDLISNMFQANPEKRPTFEMMLKSDFALGFKRSNTAAFRRSQSQRSRSQSLPVTTP